MKSPFHRTGQDNNPFRELYSRPTAGRKRNSFFGGIARFVMLILIASLAGITGIVTQGYLYFTHNLPGIEKLKNYSPPTVTEFYSDKNDLIAEYATHRRFVVKLEEVPKSLQNAFIAAEDKNFWRHAGVDKEAIIRAVKQNLTKGGIASGASTITQQVAKTFLLTPERTFIRKIKEAILATQIERSLSKEQILYLYLNQIYLGSSAYGVQAAAQTYFDKNVKDLSVAECAMIGGLAKAPGKDSPKMNLKRALERRLYVLKRMQEDGYINQAEYDLANAEEPKLVTRPNPHSKVAVDFVEQVRRYVERKYGTDALYKEGLKVYTTVDLEMTRAAHRAIDAGLRELDKRQGYRGPIKTLTVKEVMEFLKERNDGMEEPLKFGQIVEGVITQIDSENIYVRMGSYIRGNVKKEYVGQIKIDPNPKWWVRIPNTKPEWRTRNFAPGDLPFQVGDLIQVRIVDPNLKRRELYARKFAKTDPELKNYKEYSEEMIGQFPLEAEQQPLLQSALMLRENRTGYVRVLVGGSGAAESKYNRATQARRQAGSSFKPVIYAAALNKGFTCSDIIIDSPLNIPVAGEVWRPKNYRGGFQGPVTFRDAIVHSRNIPTIKILQQIGLEQAKAYARKLGYTSPLVDNLTLALGSTGVSLEEQVNAYAVFPNRGYFVPGVYVKKIVDRKGKILEERDSPVMLDDPLPKDQPQIQKVSHRVSSGGTQTDADVPDRGAPLVKRAIDEGTAYIMTSLLQGVIQEGTATVLKKIVGRKDIAGKTGTTNEAMDAWFVGFSPEYSCGVWVGFDEEIPIGDAETGGKAAAPIWGYFMREVLRDKPEKDFSAPQSVEFRKVDPKTGLMTSAPGGLMEVFKTGSGPGEGDSRTIKGSRWDYSGSDLDQF